MRRAWYWSFFICLAIVNVSCDEDDCPTCVACDGNGCVDTSALQSQLAQANHDLQKAKDDLNATQKALDKCRDTGEGGGSPDLETAQNNLESCQRELKVLKAKPKSKSGSRLKLLAYEGEDGSLSIQTGTYYDTLLKTECSAYNNMYCNDDSIYCIPRELNWALNANKQYPSYIFCSDAYSSDESIITYGSYFKSNIASSVSEIIADGRTYFANSNCTSAIEPKYGKIQYVADDDCLYNKDTVFFNTQSVLTSNSTDSRICIDGSKYEKTNPKYNAITSYYKPIDGTFHSIYYLNSNGKCEVYKKGNIILLKEIDKKEISLDIARANRRTYCESYCAALKAEAEAAGWAKIKRVQLDVE